jgi:hypothetical protein
MDPELLTVRWKMGQELDSGIHGAENSYYLIFNSQFVVRSAS